MNKNKILELIKEDNPENPLSYVNSIIQDYALNKMNNQILCCKDCKNCDTIKSIGIGPANSYVMIIGDYVSSNQATENENDDNYYVKPLSDDSCEDLYTVFDFLNIDKDKIFFMNAVNCWSHKKVGKEIISRPPDNIEITNCFVYLRHAIEIVKPKAILVLGNVANNIFRKSVISKVRGEWFDIYGIPSIGTYHPAYFKKIIGKKR